MTNSKNAILDYQLKSNENHFSRKAHLCSNRFRLRHWETLLRWDNWYPLQDPLFATNTDKQGNKVTQRDIHCSKETFSSNRGSVSGIILLMFGTCEKAFCKRFCSANVNIKRHVEKLTILVKDFMLKWSHKGNRLNTYLIKHTSWLIHHWCWKFKIDLLILSNH